MLYSGNELGIIGTREMGENERDGIGGGGVEVDGKGIFGVIELTWWLKEFSVGVGSEVGMAV